MMNNLLSYIVFFQKNIKFCVAYLLINILICISINNININKTLVINNIIFLNNNLYQADVIDNISRVFLKNIKLNVNEDLCRNANHNNCEYNFLKNNNKFQIVTVNPRSLNGITIGDGLFKLKNNFYYLYFTLQIIIYIIYLIRFKIRNGLITLFNDANFDLQNTLSTLGFYKIFIYLYLMFISLSILLLDFSSIIVWDEAVYLNTGRDLVDKFEIWPYARGPLIQIFYGFIYSIISFIGYDADWLLTLSITGKIIFLNITFLMAILSANRLKYLLPSSVYRSDIFVASTLIFFPIANLVNPSYSTYTLIFSFVFYFLLLFIQSRNLIYILMTGIFLGLLGLVRPDVSIILPMLFLSIIYFHRSIPIFRLFIYLVIPAFSIIYGYQFLIYLATGIYDTGSMVKLYLAFESAESLNLKNNYSSFLDWYNASKSLAENTYGSAASNHNNIFIAIFNNPVAFLNRELLTLKMLPGAIAEGYTFFNISNAYFLLFVMIFSLLLLYRNSKPLFFSFLAILSHLSLYFITLIYSSYLLLDFLIFSLLITIFISFLMGRSYKNKIIIFFFMIISYYLSLYLLLFMLIFVFLFFNYQTSNSIGFKFANKFVGINIFIFAIIINLLISNYKFPSAKLSDQSEINDIYKAKNIAISKCKDGNLITHTYAFPIFSKLTFLPIDSDLISNFDNKDYLVNRKIASCIFVDKKMLEENPMNILQGIEKLKSANYLIEIFKSNNITLYRIQ